jgi:hypothetical protein
MILRVRSVALVELLWGFAAPNQALAAGSGWFCDDFPVSWRFELGSGSNRRVVGPLCGKERLAH